MTASYRARHCDVETTEADAPDHCSVRLLLQIEPGIAASPGGLHELNSDFNPIDRQAGFFDSHRTIISAKHSSALIERYNCRRRGVGVAINVLRMLVS